MPRVAVPETRQLDVLADLLGRRGIDVVRCPLVAILDSPDSERVSAWIERLIADPPDLLIIYTGEGVRRLIGFAEHAGNREAFIAALAATPMLTRGPKPVRALHEIGLKPAHAALAPTTEGIIATLATLALDGRRIAVQFYGADPNEQLMSYLAQRHLTPDIVMPYVYASEADEALVRQLIERIEHRDVDAIAFTSMAQVERLFDVARRTAHAETLTAGLGDIVVAAVGPVVAEALQSRGIDVDVMPESTFFMKPLVTQLAAHLGVDRRS